MNKRGPEVANILVLEDVEEIRDGIEALLKKDGYETEPARDEDAAVARALHRSPALILVSSGANPDYVATVSRRIRSRAGLTEDVPIVIFCVQNIDEGSEVNIGHNVHISRPDNFDPLRGLLRRLLRATPLPMS